MSDLPSPSNSIAYAHFEQAGGWKRLGTYALAVLLLAGVVFTLMMTMVPDRRGAHLEELRAYLFALLLAQGAGVLFGGMRVAGAAYLDRLTNMIESHRLTPLSPAQAVIGYLLGPTTGPLMLMIICTACGIGISAMAGMPIDRWLFVSAIQYVFAAMFWTVQLDSSLSRVVGTRGGIRGLGSLLIFAMFARPLATLVPALAMLINPVENTIFAVIPGAVGATKLSNGVMFAMFLQLCLAAVFAITAARRYRAPDQRAFAPMLALVLLVLTVLLSGLGTIYNDELSIPTNIPQTGSAAIQSAMTQVTSAILVSMLIGLVPLGAVIQSNLQRRGWRKLGLPGPIYWSMPVPLAVLIIAAIILPLTVLGFEVQDRIGAHVILQPTRGPVAIGALDQYAREVLPNALGALAATTIIFLTGCGLLLRRGYRTGRRAGRWVAVWLLVVWLVPLAIAVEQSWASTDVDAPYPDNVMAASPIGSVGLLWRSGHKVWPGIAVQAAEVLVLLVLSEVIFPVKKARTVETPVTGAAEGSSGLNAGPDVGPDSGVTSSKVPTQAS
jgi:hypothetical protein